MGSLHRASSGLVLAVAVFTFAWNDAEAQTPNGAQDKTIVVEAPRVLPPPPERSASTGAPIVTTIIRIPVLYGDLDFSRPTAVERLRTRVERVAHDACLYLDRLYPATPDPQCVARAIANAQPAADAIVAAAGR